ncbi:unnamed protein product [Brachionus calyciflorus]|uniref:Uncharacterized protein n=1 Tax=Brachionus calyciflorus TaxID=104777 RepID=A0A813WMH1_9BILA|nr:unnamed protein product [Brachionus calyciflorus]
MDEKSLPECTKSNELIDLDLNSVENTEEQNEEKNDDLNKEEVESKDETHNDQVFSSVLNNTEQFETQYEKKYELCSDLVILVDEDNQSDSKSLNKLNSLSNGDFIEEDFVPNQLNISRSNSNSDDEYSNLKESNLDHLENLKNNLNQFDQNIKVIEQKDKTFLPISSNSHCPMLKSHSTSNITNPTYNYRSILNSDFTNNIIYSEATVLNRNDLSYSSSLSSSYSNINSNLIKSSNNSLTNHLELKFDSLSSIEDNSKFNLNTNALTESTLLVTDDDKLENCTHDETILNKHEANIWSETEAVINQFDQVGPSACGATAILNVLKALNFQFDIEAVCSKVKVNSRIPEEMASTTTLADYLFSRSVAGMNEKELIENIEKASDNKISGQFFHFYPERLIVLSEWLAKWIRKGAVPVALLNLQKSPMWGFVPDAWHHQMIYACDSNFIYLTNPLESKSIEVIMNELTSDSVLLVRSYDVIKRFNANKYNLLDLIMMKNHANKEKKKWYDMNVIGQVLNVLREHKLISENSSSSLQNQLDSNESIVTQAISNEINTSGSFDFIDTQNDSNRYNTPHQIHSNQNHSNSLPYMTHISIPASYKAGITLFAYKDSNLFREIMEESEIEIKK